MRMCLKGEGGAMGYFDFNPQSERIQIACRRLAAAYGRQADAEVPVVDQGGYCPVSSVRERFEDFETMIEHSVAWANSLASIDNDWPPFLEAFCTVPMVPEAFGSEIHFRETDIAVRPVISNIDRVWSLVPKRLDETSTIKRMFDWIDYAQRKLGSEVPIWTADVQSPFSVAAQIVTPDELMAACITRPQAVHHLCRMVTDFTLAMMEKHIAQIDNPAFPGRNFPSIPDSIGICIADDTPLVMLSPEMYREFAFPYNAEIGEAFGGLHIHSCGDYRHNLDNLLSLPAIRSIQVHAGPGEFLLPESSDEEVAFNRARQKITYFVDANDVSRGDQYRGHPREHYSEYVLPRLRGSDLTGCILQSCGAGGDEADVGSAIRWTRQRLRAA